jgi:hypothetical protein
MLLLLIAVQWLHVLGGIFWFGSSLINHTVLLPAIKAQPAESQKAWLQAYGSRYGRIIGPIGGLTILLGIARGLIGGVWPILGSAYGVTWLASLVLGIGIAFVGARLTGPSVTRLAAAGGGDGPLGARAERLGRLELGLFAVLFSLMIVMRFGY